MRCLTPVLLASLIAGSTVPAAAQGLQNVDRIPAGDMKWRTLAHLEYSAPSLKNVVMFPGFGLSGESFRARPDGGPSWGKMMRERGFNAFMMDNVGCGDAQEPPNRNIETLFEMGLFGAYQMPFAAKAPLVVAHGQAAGLLVRARSFEPDVPRSLVLIDPIGPQYSQPMTDLTPRQLLERRDDPDHVWRTWGFGPEYGVLREGLDLTVADAESLVAAYESDQPPYWVGLLTPMESNFEVRETMHLEGVPVLVVRTPAADREQIEREEHVVRWMREHGMKVDRLDLTADPDLRHVSGLPWVGDLAGAVLDEILAWFDSTGMMPTTGR